MTTMTMRLAIAVAIVVAATGCNQVFGLDPPVGGGDGDGDADIIDDADLRDVEEGDGPGVDASCGPGAHDEDLDGFADACDNCPHVYNDTQNDGDGDGVGAACDPHPVVGGDRMVLFLAFDVMPAQVTFVPANTGQWTVSGDTLRLLTPAGDHLVRFPLDLSVVTVGTYFAIDTFVAPTDGTTRSVGAWARIAAQPSSTPETPYGLIMETALENSGGVMKSFIQLTALEPNAQPTVGRLDPTGFAYTTGQKYSVGINAQSTPIFGSASQPGIAGGVQVPSTTLGAGDVGLRTHFTAASFYYFVAYTQDP